MPPALKWICVLVIALAVSGCIPSTEGQLDERKDPYFLAGKNRVTDRDYKGAIDAFEKALEANPHSASAHFELAVIYDEHENDYAAALYHYDRAVRLRPNDYPADNARERIAVCKRELAKSVAQTPSMENMQRELDRLTLENQQLRQRLDAWQAYYAGLTPVFPGQSNATVIATNPVMLRPATALVARADVPVVAVRTNPPARPGVTAAPAVRAVAPAGRVHRVVQGDTLAGIARRYGVKLSALQAANPSMEARHLRVGQTVKIPTQ